MYVNTVGGHAITLKKAIKPDCWYRATRQGYRFDFFLVFCAGLFWSAQGLAIRLIEASDARQILFYRSISLGIFLAGVIFFEYGSGFIRAARETGFTSAVSAVCLVFAYAFGILAMR